MDKNNCAEVIEGNVQSFGARLSKFIEKLGMNKRRLASEIGMSPQSISNYCAGKNQPKPKLLEILVQRYGANREWLMSGSGPMLSGHPGVPEHKRSHRADTETQLAEANQRLAEQILANVELRDMHSKWRDQVLKTVAVVAKAKGLSSDQHMAIVSAVIDPAQALAEMDIAVSHQQAVGD